MDLNNYKELSKCLFKASINPRPQFYDGRIATIDDLDSIKLEIIYRKIVKLYGNNSGENFIEMIKDIKILNASKFVKSLYNLYDNNWTWNSNLEEDVISDDLDINSALMPSLLNLVGMNIQEVMMSKIKDIFLYKHNINIPKDKSIINTKEFLDFEEYFKFIYKSDDVKNKK